MATVEVRGAAFLTFLEALKALRGPATEAAVRAALPHGLRESLESGVLTRVGWYPLADYSSLHTATDAVLHGGADFARHLGRITTEIDTKGLIRYVLAIASPDLLMRYASKVFSSYARGATVTSKALGPRHYELHWEGLVGATNLVHAEMEGSTAFLAVRAGAKNVHIEAAAAQSSPEHTFHIRWE